MVSISHKITNINVIKEWQEFARLKNVWQALLKQSDADSIFLTWEWIDCWRKTQDPSIKPFIIVIQEDQQIVAIAPFYIHPYRFLNLLTYRALRMVGDKETGAEYGNFIVQAERSVTLKNRLWQSLLSPEIAPFWDFVWFTNVSAWTDGGASLVESCAAVKGLNCNRRTVEFALLPEPILAEDILPSLSKSLRTNIGQTGRRLDRLGPWKMAFCDNHLQLQEHLEQLFNLHNKHWLKAGGGSFQRRPELANFYRCFVPIALEKGWLRLLKLESKGEIQAMQLGYVYNNQFLAIQEGYNPDFLAGVGHLLRYFSLQNCQREALKGYDFLGIYTDHKRRWLAEKKLGADLFIWQNKIKNIPFAVTEIWPTGRYLKPFA